jgi:uncharacterized membrane protein YbaN (DUF454 family)
MWVITGMVVSVGSSAEAALAVRHGNMPGMTRPTAIVPSERSHWQRVLWLLAGVLSLLTGIVGIFLPLLPTTPFVLLAAFCFSRGSLRCEAWLLNHPRFGPMVRDWRANRAIPLRAKQLATVMMAMGSAWAWWVMPARLGWLPALLCAAVAAWMWRLPNAPPTATPRRADD